MKSKMAAIFLLVFVMVSIPVQRTFGFDCTVADYDTIMNCDQCIKCGGLWCINPKENEHHCALNRGDNGCSTDDRLIYPLLKTDVKRNKKEPIDPYYVEDSIKVRGEKPTINFKTPTDEIDLSDIKYTGNSLPKVEEKEATCSGDKCGHVFSVSVDENFCSETGGPIQHFNISLKIKNVELAKMRYNVACACECSKNVSVNAEYCSGRGNLSCGVCACDERWEGTHCELEKPYDETEYKEPPYNGCQGRGDANCVHDYRQDVECSGNGKCGDCCICDRTKVGWQYFIREKYCEDICMTTAMLLKTDLDPPPVRFIRYNETVTKQIDSKGRKIWVKCNETIEELIWEFYARKNAKGEIGVMILRKTSPEAAKTTIESGGVNVTALVVPLVVVAALAAAAVAYYVFHTQGGAPPSSRANYQGLDGPKTRVETNPVYIEPIKSYKNPTYGQNQ